MSTVSILKSESYDPTILEASIEKHFELLNLDEILSPTLKILIKPNLIMRRKPEEATTTHPEVIAAIITALQKRGITDITLADSSGGLYNATAMKSVYNGTGMTELAARMNIKLNMDFSFETVKYLEGTRCKQFQVITPALHADMIINVAKLKTHAMTGMSGACKNMFGVIPGLIKPELHCRFPDKSHFGEMLNDLCEYIKPTVSFIDGVIAMQGNGPTGGEPRFLGVTLAGKNPHAVDLAICEIIKMDPTYPSTLSNAIKRGLVPENLSEITLLGDDIKSFIVDGFKKPDSISTDFVDKLPKFARPLISKLVTPKPVIKTKKCVGCAKCAESCPQKCIQMISKKAVINYSDCIKCYCCHEMCPYKAIDIKRVKLFNL